MAYLQYQKNFKEAQVVHCTVHTLSECMNADKYFKNQRRISSRFDQLLFS